VAPVTLAFQKKGGSCRSAQLLLLLL